MRRAESILIRSSDIIDVYGRVYLKKGKRVTLDEDTIIKFSELGILNKVLMEKYSGKKSEKEIINSIKRKIVDKFSFVNSVVFEEASREIQDILQFLRDGEMKLHINTLANYLEWHYSHSVNTAVISIMIGIKLGYDKVRIRELGIGALLHDIGMLLIPKEIFSNIDNLTGEDRRVLEKHCELGYSMVENSIIPEKSKEIILRHHERYDGKGYPFNLKSEDVIEEGNIVLLSSLYDFVNSNIPLELKNQKQQSLNELLEVKGACCSKVIKAFESVMFI